jgi:mono/diheme cytochrome c family protein
MISMLRKLVILIVILAAIGAAAFWFLTIPQAVPASALGPHKVDLANGKEVFFAAGCETCHATPKQDDKTRLGGGLALATEFGTFYVPNISSDPHDGIGGWSEAQFLSAVTRGTSPSGQHLYPALPYTTYAHAKIGDLRDMFAYIKTLPKVPGKVRDHDLRFPFNVRRGIGLWKLVNLDTTPIASDASKPAAWNRGNYLVNALAHCAECHSPRDAFGGLVESQRFAGGPTPDGKGWVPNITQKGIGSWSEKDIAYMLETGTTPEGDSVGGEMEAVVSGTAELSEADRAAIAAYIKSLPPVDGPKPPKKAEQKEQ